MSAARRFVPVEAARRLAVWRCGAGRPVLGLHGFTGHGLGLLDSVEALGPGFLGLLPDLVGHGDSDLPRDAAGYRMERAVEDLVAVLDALDQERVHLLGYSMGARLGLALALRHPERVRSALLVGARAGLADPAERRARIAADETLARSILEDGIPAFVERWMALPLFASQRRLGRERLAAARQQRLANRAEGLAGSLRGMGAGAQPPLFDRLGALGVPVCLVVGAEDAKFRAAAEDLATRLPEARLAVVPEAGHAAHLENPTGFGRLARRFFDEVDARRPDAPSGACPSPQLQETP